MKVSLFQILFGVVLMLTMPKFVLADEMAASSSPVEKRIEELHTKLKITKEQETMWTTVAKEMRDSSQSIADATSEREKGAQGMSALDDLKSYAAIQEMHSKSMKKFLDAFTPLYNSMTPDQKKNADVVFREHKHGKKHTGGKA